MTTVPFYAHDAPAHPHPVHRKRLRGFVVPVFIILFLLAIIIPILLVLSK